MTKYRVALLDVYAEEVLAKLYEELPEDFELLATTSYDEQELLGLISDADFILAGWCPVPAHFLDAAPKLKLLQKWGSGVEKFDLKAAAERGIPVAITSGANSISVAEMAICLMLATYRQLPYLDRSLRNGVWLKREAFGFTYGLRGKTVGLVGLGNIGREMAKRLQGFDVKLTYFSRTRRSPEVEAQLGVQYRPLDELLAEADVISVQIPLSAQTRNLIDAREISLMKPTTIVINVARGGVVNEAALIDALSSGRILGAGLDVYETEPPSVDNPLMKMDNVVLVPHIAGATLDDAANVARHSFNNMQKVLRGEPLRPEDVVRA